MAAKLNAPFEMSNELQAEFDETAETLKMPKVQLLRMAVAKGLPIVRNFLLSEKEREKFPPGFPKPTGDVALNAAAPHDDDEVTPATFRPRDEDVTPR